MVRASDRADRVIAVEESANKKLNSGDFRVAR